MIGQLAVMPRYYGERYRNGEAIATGFVESTVHQVVSPRFCKRQQMQWSKRGAAGFGRLWRELDMRLRMG
jgi:hypothetical protein